MLIRKVQENVYDVFGNVGWPMPDTYVSPTGDRAAPGVWTRVRKHKWGMAVIAGEKVDHRLWRDIQKVINENPDGNLDNVDARAAA